MKLFPLLSLLCLCVLGTSTTASAAGRERARFDDGWKFHLQDGTLEEPPAARVTGAPVVSWRWHLTKDAAVETAAVLRPDFDDHAWDVVQSAHNVIREPNTSAWFRAVLPNTAAPRPRLHFTGVDDEATVYLNGKKLLQHSGWEEAFDVPLADAWRKDAPNILVILVENLGGSGGIDPVYVQSDEMPPPVTADTGPASVAFDDHAWRDVQLPHDFIVEGTFDPKADPSHGFLPKGAGWYRKTFTLPAEDQGKVLWLEFDGVYRNSLVWLNGQLLGQHASGYTSFYYDVSRVAHYGGQNVLTVWADARQNEGWWYEGGGIYRHVYLTKLAPVHFAHWGTKIDTTLPEDLSSAMINVSLDVENNGVPQYATCDYRIIGPDGGTVSTLEPTSHTLAFPVGDPLPLGSRAKILSPKLWSPDAPNLYKLAAVLRQNGQIVDEVTTTFGIRSLRWDKDQGFFLNGKPFKIQGTCNHQDFAGIGVALPDRVHYYKVEKLKQMGCNAFRFSHQPMAPELLDACDRLGMIVMDENRKLSDSVETLAQVESLVRRDRNHPSVVMWSMCNEESLQGTERGGRMFAAMKDTVLKWDRSRPVTSAMNGGFGGGISLVEDLQGFNYNTGQYDGFHKALPGLPCYGSETASETTTRGVYEDDKAKGYVGTHRTTAEGAWKPIAERAWMAGGFVWTGFDYRGEPTPYQWPCVNSHFGIMDTCGFPKDSYYYYQSEWIDKPAAHLSQHWNYPGREGQEIPVWVTGNAAKYELFLNGASLGTRDMPPHQHVEWKVKYQPGTLETRGYDAQGHAVASDQVQTTGAPARLKLERDRQEFAADREDVAVVRCAVLDAEGRVVPVAGDEITFEAKGPAHLAGVGNGDPSDHDPDKASKRHAFNGHCLAVVQSESTAGTVTLTASAPGLQSATITLQTR